MKKDRVLLVDDDREAAFLYQKYLEKKGYQADVCGNSTEALQFLTECQPDCVVLDVMMPGEDGFQFFPELRKRTSAPILFFSGKGDAEDRVRGLSLGADDYITKPCSLEELLLRIALNIRKQRLLAQPADVLVIPPLRIDFLEHKVYCGETEVPLSNREFELLLLLAKNEGQTLAFEEIAKAMTGTCLTGDRQTIMVNASRLRKKLEVYAGCADLIETVRGEGYRLKAEADRKAENR